MEDQRQSLASERQAEASKQDLKNKARNFVEEEWRRHKENKAQNNNADASSAEKVASDTAQDASPIEGADPSKSTEASATDSSASSASEASTAGATEGSTATGTAEGSAATGTASETGATSGAGSAMGEAGTASTATPAGSGASTAATGSATGATEGSAAAGAGTASGTASVGTAATGTATTGATAGATAATEAATAGASVAATGTAATGAGATAGATAATAGAAGAATGGVGAAVVLAVAAAKYAADKAKAEMDSLWYAGDPAKEMGKTFTFILLAACCMVVVLASWITPFATIASGVTSHVEEAYSYVQELFLSEKEKDFLKIFEKTIYTEEMDDYINTPRKIDATNIEIYKDIIDIAVDKAFREYAAGYVWGIDSFFKILFEDYSYKETYNTYLQQPYPYTLRSDPYDPDSYYTIEEYLNGEIPEDEVNNDLNYAEIITVLCQRSENGFETFSFSSFYDLLMADDVGELLFELEYGDTHFGIYNEDGELLIDDDAYTYASERGIEVSVKERSEDYRVTKDFVENPPVFENGFYFNSVTVKPYGLQELYQIAEVDPYGENEQFPKKENYAMLDVSEKWLRETMPKGINLGPSSYEKRSYASLVYNDIWLATDYGEPTGRSLYNYLERSVVAKDPVFEEWDDPEEAINHIDYTPSGESVILNMSNYINQGSAPYRSIPIGSKTVKNIGCCVCSYSMVIGYYEQKEMTPTDVRDIISSFVGSDRLMQYGKLLTSKGLSFMGESEIRSKWPDCPRVERIVNLITEGKPVVIYIKGLWEYDGTVYHKSENSHYLVIMGYDETGFYVFDPGSNKNTTSGPIPYEAFEVAPCLEIASSKGGGVYYKINTILTGGKKGE